MILFSNFSYFKARFKDKKVLVLGLARSGESAARLLDKLGAIVTVNDGKPFEENPTAQSLLEDKKVLCNYFAGSQKSSQQATEPRHRQQAAVDQRQATD